jgi:sugar phosphate permease
MRPTWFHDRFTKDDDVGFGFFHGIATVLGNWRLWVVGMISSTIYLPLSVVAALWGNTFMEVAGGYSAEQASFATIMLAVGWLVGCPLAGIISDRIGSRRWPLIIGSAGGFIMMLLFLWPAAFGYWGLLAIMLIGGLVTSTQVVCFAVAMEVCPKSLRGTAVASCNFITMMVAAGLQVIIGWVLTAEVMAPTVHRTTAHAAHAADLLQDADPVQFRLAMAIIPALFVVSLALCFVLPETAPGKGRVEPT